MAYSLDYREAAVEYKKNGHTFKELKEAFKITPQTYYNWLALKEEKGSFETRKVETRKRKIDFKKLKQAVEEKPDAYLKELAEPFNCTPQAVHYALERYKITYKKRRFCTLSETNRQERNFLKK